MAYIIQLTLNAEQPELREGARADHIAYLGANTDRIMAAGPLFNEDSSFLGGLTILDTEDRDEADAFIQNDPIYKSGAVTGYTLTRWRRTFLDGKEYSHD